MKSKDPAKSTSLQIQVHRNHENYMLSTSHSPRLLNNEYSKIHPQQPHFISHSLSSGLTSAKKGFQCIKNTYTSICACLVGLLPRLIPLKHNTRRILRAASSLRFNINKEKIKTELHCSAPRPTPFHLYGATRSKAPLLQSLQDGRMKTDDQQQVAYHSNKSREQCAHRSDTQTQHANHHNIVNARLLQCADSAHSSAPVLLCRCVAAVSHLFVASSSRSSERTTGSGSSGARGRRRQ